MIDIRSVRLQPDLGKPRVLIFGPLICRVRGDQVERPSEQARAEEPEAGRDDQPEDAAQEIAVVDLSDARDDQAEDRGRAGIVFAVARHRACSQGVPLSVASMMSGRRPRRAIAWPVPRGIETKLPALSAMVRPSMVTAPSPATT